jgi:hypothetical protein
MGCAPNSRPSSSCCASSSPGRVPSMRCGRVPRNCGWDGTAPAVPRASPGTPSSPCSGVIADNATPSAPRGKPFREWRAVRLRAARSERVGCRTPWVERPAGKATPAPHSAAAGSREFASPHGGGHASEPAIGEPHPATGRAAAHAAQRPQYGCVLILRFSIFARWKSGLQGPKGRNGWPGSMLRPGEGARRRWEAYAVPATHSPHFAITLLSLVGAK